MRWVSLLICLICASAARADDWGVKRDPFDRAVIARYKAILARAPHDSALAQLTAMYKRYRSVALLETEYRAQLDAAPADWATLVVLARMPRSDRTATLALWNRALAANPKDGRGWLALGKMTHEPRQAREAFKHAVELAAPKEKRGALIELIGAARSAQDHATVDGAYAELIALAPKDGQLWLDRGDAQLAAGKPAPALDSFSTAEKLLATDPERRLTAMTSRGVALERLGRVDDALAQWDLALDRTPRTSYQRRDIVSRIIAAERTRHQITAAIDRLEKRWKEAQRGHYEWDVLGDLELEAHRDNRALLAFTKAVKKAPTEVETQRKLIKLLDELRPGDALAQHEAAARIAPGDANLQLDLARRYHDKLNDDLKAYTTLDKLTIRHARSPGVRLAMAELFTQWEDNTRALHEYEAVANLEPDEPDHAVTLGDMYWANNQQAKAVAAWLRLEKIRTVPTQLRLGDIMSRRELWSDAERAYSRVIELAPTNSEAWRGRARANSQLDNQAMAVSDARRAVALQGLVDFDGGQRMRFELVRALSRTQPPHARRGTLSDQLARWRYAFDHGDVAAGYLLVAHHTRIQSPHLHDVMVALYQQVPNDDMLGLAVARSHSRRKEFDAAKTELEKIARRTPKRADDIKYLLAQVEDDRERAIEDRFREEEGFKDAPPPKNIVDRRAKLGFRFGIGLDVGGTSAAVVDLGLYGTRRVARGTVLEWRLAWSQRDDDAEEVNAFGGGIAIATRIFQTRRFEVAAGTGPRFEVRYGRDSMDSPYGRTGISWDSTLELFPRSLPANLGVRLQHNLTDDSRSSALWFELGFEIR